MKVLIAADFRYLAINLVPQQRRAFERDHSARVQGQVLSGGRVPASSGRFSFDNEFSKPTDENILTIYEGGLDGLQDGFSQARGFGFGNVELALNGTYDVVFGKGHWCKLQEKRVCFEGKLFRLLLACWVYHWKEGFV